MMLVQPCLIDLAVDGVLADPQPMSLRLVTAEPAVRYTPSRHPLMIRKHGGRRLVIQWGEDFLTLSAGVNIRRMFPDSDPNHLLQWSEPDGTRIEGMFTVEAVSVRWTQAQAGFIEPLILTAHELPAGGQGGIAPTFGASIGGVVFRGANPLLIPVWTDRTPTPTGTVGVAYSTTLTATGTPTFTIVGGRFPGVTLHPTTGVLSGTPTLAGTFRFFVKVENASGFAMAACTVVIA
jgi:hypothetical protein